MSFLWLRITFAASETYDELLQGYKSRIRHLDATLIMKAYWSIRFKGRRMGLQYQSHNFDEVLGVLKCTSKLTALYDRGKCCLSNRPYLSTWGGELNDRSCSEQQLLSLSTTLNFR
jgi:hypothetical protein